MKKLIRSSLGLSCAVLISHTTSVFGQGSLTPPPGAPAPSMKTLDQIEARKPIGIPNQTTTTTIVITNPGSYVLMGPITVSSGNGITILTNNVTLDLNGFTISSSANPRAGYGVAAWAVGSGLHNGITVCNGNISSTDANDHSGSPGFLYGVDLSHGSGNINMGSYVHGVKIGSIGFGIIAKRVEKCSVQIASFKGIAGEDLVKDCHVDEFTTNGPAISSSSGIVLNCKVGRGGGTSFGTRSIGIYGTIVENCMLNSLTEGIGIQGQVVKSCYVYAYSASGANPQPIIATTAIGCVTVVNPQQQNPPTNSIVNRYLMPLTP